MTDRPNRTLRRRSVLALTGAAVAAVATRPAAAWAATPGRPALAADQWVLAAQQWLNRTYGTTPGYQVIAEDGFAGGGTITALVRALQLELGSTGAAVDGKFGAGTLATLTGKFGNIRAGSPTNVVTIVQAALYCKGYLGDSLTGTYGPTTAGSVLQLRTDMGFTDSRTELAPKEFRGLLTLDAYVLTTGGAPAVRTVQQWLNRTYVTEPLYDLLPTDGQPNPHASDLLVYALQTELKVPGANAVFGPATRAALKATPALEVGAKDTGTAQLVRIFQAGLILNRFEVPFTGEFVAATATQVTALQTLAKLPVSGIGDFATFASLLTVSGDPDRPGTALDCSKPVTAAKAQVLYESGYRIVGRYLTARNKLQPGELDAIFGAGLRVYPIYQTDAQQAGYFTEKRGTDDGGLAIEAATGFGFEPGTVIYFAVDFPALDATITSNVIPYFRAVKAAVHAAGDPYRIGVYGARNVGTRLANEGLTVFSVVADLAPGWAGNFGYRLPSNWAFDQFVQNVEVSASDGTLTVDKSVSSGRDPGVAKVTPPRIGGRLR